MNNHDYQSMAVPSCTIELHAQKDYSRIGEYIFVALITTAGEGRSDQE
jgi:hypothetical protein